MTPLEMRERKVVDLGKYRSAGIIVYAGRDRGKAVRKDCGLEDGDSVKVIVPRDVITLCAGFPDELLKGITDVEWDADADIIASVNERLERVRRFA